MIRITDAMKPALLLTLFSVIAHSLCAQTEVANTVSEPDVLTRVRLRYEEEIQKATAQINEGYKGALETLIKDLGSRGDIDGALVVKKELDGLATSQLTPPEVEDGGGAVPPDLLVILRGKYDGALRTAMVPINEKYRDFLVALKKELGGQGDLAAAKIVQAELEKLGLPERPPLTPGNDRRDRIVIWNQTNGGKNDRGSSKANVILKNGENEIWRKENVALSWVKDQDSSTEIEIPVLKADRIRIEITEFYSSGGGLAEVEFFRNGQNLALGRRAVASGYWESNENHSPSRVTDGRKSGKSPEDRFWLLPNQNVGWIEILLNETD